MSGLAFRPIEEPGSWGLSEWWPEAVGLVVAVFATGSAMPGGRIPALSSVGIWSLAAQCTVPVFLVTGAAVYGACRMTERAPRDSFETAASLACAATWLAPLPLFLRQNSPWGAGVAAALALLGTRGVLLRSTVPAASFFVCLVTALALQAGGVAATIGDWQAAAITLGIGAGLLAWVVTARGLWPARRGFRVRMIPAFLLAVAFSAGGLTPYMARGAGRGGVSNFLRVLFGAAEPGEQAETAKPVQIRAYFKDGKLVVMREAVIMGDSYPAVMLWPDVEPFTTLVAPPPPSDHALFFGGRAPETYGIPFSGYYYFQRDLPGLPARSYTMHGDPAERGMRTTDLTPLIMEAHQDFGTAVAMNCCREIRLLMRVADPRPGTVRVGLDLVDRTRPGAAPERLGFQPLAETVTFAMPAASHLVRFDRVVVRFRMGYPRGDRSARAAVRRFVFVR